MLLPFKIILKEFKSLAILPEGRRFLYLAGRYGGKPRHHKINVKFGKYKIKIADSLSFIWQYKEIFTDENYKFESGNTKPVIIDCGANIGLSCLYFKKLYPGASITAFEAAPEIADLLENNMSINSHNDVTVIKKAVWINNDGVEMNLEQADSSSIFGKGSKVMIPSMRLKDFIMNQAGEIDMLKMDIEGAETDVIRDCNEVLSKVKNIFIEYHSITGRKQDLEDILKVLNDNSFRYYVLPVSIRSAPLINRTDKNNESMDMQLNIYAYKPGR